MKIIGITGGVGSGKSRVLSYLEITYGASICQADHVAWELQTPGTTCYREIVECFGTEILSSELPDAAIDRAKLGQIVFADTVQLTKLNAIMHPAVKQEIERRIEQEKERGTKFFILEAALLIEEDYGAICDELWYIYTSESIRRQRLKESRQYSDARINEIMTKQLSEDVFRIECDRVIENSGEFADTARQIAQILQILKDS